MCVKIRAINNNLKHSTKLNTRKVRVASVRAWHASCCGVKIELLTAVNKISCQYVAYDS
jgi:hypothetical protein